MQESIVFLVRVQCRRKRKFTFAISSPDEFLVIFSLALLLLSLPYYLVFFHRCLYDE